MRQGQTLNSTTSWRDGFSPRAWPHFGATSSGWTPGFGANCAAFASNHANAARPSLRFFSDRGSPRMRPGGSLPPGRAGGVWLSAPRSSAPCLRSGSLNRSWRLCFLDMLRYTVKRNRRIRQVRTVVWEDGAARPLLPDPGTFSAAAPDKPPSRRPAGFTIAALRAPDSLKAAVPLVASALLSATRDPSGGPPINGLPLGTSCRRSDLHSAAAPQRRRSKSKNL
jgi:hypothetical protein